MKKYLIVFLFFISNFLFSQVEDNLELKPLSKTVKVVKPSIDLYKIYTLQKDTTFVDTTLSIQKEYKYNLLRKDIFGLLPFSNEGHTYNTLDYSLVNKDVFPSFGFSGKHFNYLEATDIKYYNVPTPLTDLYFKTVMEQGQSLDAFLTINTKPNLNFSIAYKGLRSNGKYINNISSSGNFRFTTSYFSTNKKYFLNAHFAGQDISNQENGGIIDVSLFESSIEPYNGRDRIDVYFRDATSLLKGNRLFADHYYKFNTAYSNSLVVFHQINAENKFFQFSQPSVNSRFGNSFTNYINNKTRYNHLYNKVGVNFKPVNLGEISVYIDNAIYNYHYKSILFDNLGNVTVPNALNGTMTAVGGTYNFAVNKFNIGASIYNSITKQSVSSFEAYSKFKLDSINSFEIKFTKKNTLPSLNYTLYQSDYIEYNWFNNFKNEKITRLEFNANTKFARLTAQYSYLNDYLYFENTSSNISSITVKAFQYDKTIEYLSVKASKEFKFRKFALDNTILYQNVENSDKHLNVPQLVSRNTLYYTDFVFKKAMKIQTGFTFQYFSKYYANDYNPLLGEFYVQNETKIGDFPMVDFFINAQVKQVRLFLKAEHFNAAWTGYDYYSAPNYPYRDFMVRFGLVWNFFQ